MTDERRKRRKSATKSATRIEDIPEFRNIVMMKEFGRQAGVPELFFHCHDGVARDVTHIGGKEYLSFSSYNYLGLNGSAEVNDAAQEAMRLYGTSAGANRLSSGERPPHRLLEREFADFLGTEDCLAFVSGYTTNTSVLSHLFGKKDLIVHDAKSHNSLVMGSLFSGATRFSYPHNDMEALETYLKENRAQFERAIIVTEGLFSMDGSTAPLPKLVELKNNYDCFLMLDEAHSIGVIGDTGKGATEHYGVDINSVDVVMGTLSKTFCGCGGFIAGTAALIDGLRYSAPGFLYSVGMPPPIAAASARALQCLRKEPERAARLREIGKHFLAAAKDRGLDTGVAEGFSIIPVIIGDSLAASFLSGMMFENGVNVMPVLYPVVEENAARLRFFLTSEHKRDQVEKALDLVVRLLPGARTRSEAVLAEFQF